MQTYRYTTASAADAIDVAKTATKPGAYTGASLGLKRRGPTKLPGSGQCCYKAQRITLNHTQTVSHEDARGGDRTLCVPCSVSNLKSHQHRIPATEGRQDVTCKEQTAFVATR
jgi:hypothetical protein